MSGVLRGAKAAWHPHVGTGELVFAPIYSRFSYTEGPAVDGSKYLSLLVSTCGRGRYVGKIVRASQQVPVCVRGSEEYKS